MKPASTTRKQDTSLAVAGAAGAAIWGLQQPLDRRAFASDYSDVELLGKLVTRGPAWAPLGLSMHMANGAAFGLLYSHVLKRVGNRDPLPIAVGLALTEHVAMWPAAAWGDRSHPAVVRGEHPKILRDPRAFAQGAWRHLILGLVLGLSARRIVARH